MALNPKYNGYQTGFVSMMYNFFFEKKTGSKVSVNEDLAQDKKNKEIRKVYASFKDNIWAAELVEMRPLSQKNQGVKFFSCVIDVFTKNVRVRSLKDKNIKTVFNGFIEIANKSRCTPYKYQVDQGKQFYNSLKQKWLGDNDNLMYSTRNKGKSTESFKRILKAKTYN